MGDRRQRRGRRGGNGQGYQHWIRPVNYNRYANYGKSALYGGAGLAYQALKNSEYLKGLINTEFKAKDTYVSPSVTTSGSLTLLNGLAKGDTLSTRTGRSVLFKSLQISIQAVINGSATTSRCRAIVFIDKQVNATTPTIAELLDTSTASALMAMRNLNWRKRFVILKDKSFVLDSDQHPEIIINKFLYKKMGMHTIYDDSDAGTVADISSNALYIMLVSDEAVNAPGITVQARVRYLDN